MSLTSPSRIRILLADHHALFRESLARLLGDEPDFEITAKCASVEAAVSVVSAGRVDLVLLDLELGGERGFTFLERARRIGFDGPVLVLAAAISRPETVELVKLGAAGFILKESPPELLAKSIRQVMRGELWLDQRYREAVAQIAAASVKAPKPPFTERERAVLRGVLEGLLNKEIAHRLGISMTSVKAALQQLFFKTGVKTRGQLVRVALEKYRGQV